VKLEFVLCEFGIGIIRIYQFHGNAEAVRSLSHTVADRVRTRAVHTGFGMDKLTLEQVSLGVFFSSLVSIYHNHLHLQSYL
jgi:hypothetical protein